MGVPTGASWFTGIARSQPDGGSFATSLFQINHNLASNHVVGVQMKSPSQFRFWPPGLSRAETHFVRCPEGNLSVLHSRPNAQRESINAAASDAPRHAMIWRPGRGRCRFPVQQKLQKSNGPVQYNVTSHAAIPATTKPKLSRASQ